MVKYWRKGKFQEATLILFRFFQQPKEDSSEDMSDKTLAYFFDVSYIVFLNPSALVYNIFLYCSSWDLLMIRAFFYVNREIDIVGEVGTIH